MKIRFMLAFMVTVLVACSNDDNGFSAGDVCPVDGTNRYGEANRGVFVDERDGRVYNYTTIGDQVWMAENLHYEFAMNSVVHPRTGEMALARDTCWYPEDNCEEMGLVYNWNAAFYACPQGWHFPIYREWITLVESMGGRSAANVRLRATTGWKELNRGENINGTDDCGFRALPAQKQGTRPGYSGYTFEAWAYTDEINVFYFKTYSYGSEVKMNTADAGEWELKSVRCVKD